MKTLRVIIYLFCILLLFRCGDSTDNLSPDTNNSPEICGQTTYDNNSNNLADNYSNNSNDDNEKKLNGSY